MIRSGRTAWWAAVAVALGLAACAKQEQVAAPLIEDKTFALAPATAPLKVSFLTGELKDLRVIERVERGTGRVVDPPKLRGTLKLKNSSADQVARLVSGKIEYVDAGGTVIPLAEGRGDTSFRIYSYQTERLDPGMESSQDIEVPFPAAALNDKKLANVRLAVTYIPTPYREETTSVPVSLTK